MIDLKNIMGHARRRDSRLSGAWLLGFLLLLPVGSRAAVHNVRDYGAKGDGKAIDSPAINAAIGAAVKAGGGTVYFPAGTYASYSIRLESHITLYLEKGAVLLAAKPSATEGYDAPEPCPYDDYQDFGHSHWKNSLIWGIGLESMDGGDLEDVVIGNLTMRRVVGAPLFIRLGARMRSPEGRETGHIRRVRIHDVNAVYDTPPLFGIIIAGIPGHPVEDISIRCLHVHATGGLTSGAGCTSAMWTDSSWTTSTSPLTRRIPVRSSCRRMSRT